MNRMRCTVYTKILSMLVFIIFFSTDCSISTWFSGWKHTQEVASTQEYTTSSDAHIQFSNLKGKISIRSWKQPKVLLEIKKCGTAEELGHTNVSVNNKNDMFTVATSTQKNSTQKKHPSPCSIHYHAIVPENAKLTLKCDKGNIKVRNTNGSVRAQTNQGDIDLYNVAQTTHATAKKGNITVHTRKIKKDNTLLAMTNKGKINVYLPEKTNAAIDATTESGFVSSEIPITLNPRTMKISKSTIRSLAKEIHGTIGKKDAHVKLYALQGAIKIFQH